MIKVVLWRVLVRKMKEKVFFFYLESCSPLHLFFFISKMQNDIHLFTCWQSVDQWNTWGLTQKLWGFYSWNPEISIWLLKVEKGKEMLRLISLKTSAKIKTRHVNITPLNRTIEQASHRRFSAQLALLWSSKHRDVTTLACTHNSLLVWTVADSPPPPYPCV